MFKCLKSLFTKTEAKPTSGRDFYETPDFIEAEDLLSSIRSKPITNCHGVTLMGSTASGSAPSYVDKAGDFKWIQRNGVSPAGKLDSRWSSEAKEEVAEAIRNNNQPNWDSRS